MNNVSSVELINPPMTTAASGFLNLAPRPGRKEHGHKSERGDAGGDEHGAQLQHRAFDNGEFDVDALAAQFTEVTHHHDAVEHRHAKERDEADAGADAHVEVPDEQPMSANGMFRMMSSACFTELNEPNRSRKIAAMVIGTTMLNRFVARCWFSN
jgi:hypothetical protein